MVNVRVIFGLSLILLSTDTTMSSFLMDFFYAVIDLVKLKSYEEEYFNQNQEAICERRTIPVNISQELINNLVVECTQQFPNGNCSLETKRVAFRKVESPFNPVEAQIFLLNDEFAFAGTVEGSMEVYGLMRDKSVAEEIYHISGKHPLKINANLEG